MKNLFAFCRASKKKNVMLYLLIIWLMGHAHENKFKIKAVASDRISFNGKIG